MATRVFVGGLPKVCSDQDLWEGFQCAFGAVRYAYVKRFQSGCSRGFGFVDFVDMVSRDQAVTAGSLVLKDAKTEIKSTVGDKMATAERAQRSQEGAPAEGSAAEATEVQLSKWGLDPIFNTAVRLLACTLHSTESFIGIPGSSKLCGRPVVLVQLVGSIVKIEVKEKYLRFLLDDGSGVVWCIHWFESAELKWDDRILGEVANVRGRITMYQGERQVTIQSVFIERVPNEEVLHWLQAIQLYQDCYSKPPIS
eukprot:TRINITY_DN51315_c0_g1_i1.p2 TRINITY_DN51315_c0_g1~~TRINITY_DN51315_c0_g1_i1.p2  ORF type:complete len:253 (+),score=43.48 TRINITY_DN51315_c0_g1_i1:200-958(+)